jgi:hypothetical protein
VSANLDLVRSIYSDWERGDYTRVEWAHPEIDFVIKDGLGSGRWSGVADMARGWRDALSAWSEAHSEAEEYRELDDERVLTLARVGVRGKASGIELPETWTRQAILFHIQSGKVTRLVVYLHRNHGLAELDLAPEGEAADELE